MHCCPDPVPMSSPFYKQKTEFQMQSNWNPGPVYCQSVPACSHGDFKARQNVLGKSFGLVDFCLFLRLDLSMWSRLHSVYLGFSTAAMATKKKKKNCTSLLPIVIAELDK